ncbi:lipocalin family protein [Paraburkholderia sp. MMS20-SJTN17]|uniref:Outer membrane lipoprotein Blc n=1 Tax=Paraburkholderia translucens TaxID=2886945 RepID=A0ABS8K704_9BURK|nr:lipocalin family protein [Paraburkholderia sp. MMS20-SJTN17]MCC8400515.1 lipocalin family protein [Paraburkholderia sp. MMS20-SJTN17]
MRKSIACLAAFAASLTGCVHVPAAAPDPPAPHTACVAGPPIDLQRYMGKWFVIAETPYLGDAEYVGSYDEWTLRADGKISDDYLGQRQSFDQPVTGSHFVAKIVRGTGNTTWRVGLIWPFEVRVVTAYVDPDYQYTIRCMVDSNMVWILSRSPTMDEATYLNLIARLAGMGFNIGRIRRVPQKTGRIEPPRSE